MNDKNKAYSNIEQRNRRCDELFLDYANAISINEENLRILMQDNKDTKYGKLNHFSKIDSAEKYAELVPLTEYADYRDKISEDPSYYTAYPIHGLLATSGSIGKQKILPVSETAMERYSSFVHDVPYYLGKVVGKAVHMSVFRPAVNGINILSSVLFRYYNDSGLVDFDSYVGGKDLLIVDTINDIPYVKCWQMLSCKELAAIEAIYLYDVAMVFSWLEENWQNLVADMREGRVNAGVSAVQKQLLLDLVPDGERLDEIEGILDEGFSDPIISRLWPNLKFIAGIGGKLYVLQEKQLHRYRGDVPVYELAYALSECIVGTAVGLESAHYAMHPRAAYYEFISKKDSGLVKMQDLELGETYELVLSTFSGLYRYRTGDLIRIVRFQGKAPVFEMVGKRAQIIDIAGEKIDVYTATAIVSKWAVKYGLETSDFAMGINTKSIPNGYILFIESELDNNLDGAEETLDSIIREMCVDYEDLCGLGLISTPIIAKLPYGTIRGANNNPNKMAHSKPQIFINEDKTRDLIERSREYERGK